MTTDPCTHLDLEPIKARLSAATPGEWSSDSERSCGSYGSGDDTHEGFAAYAVYAEIGGKSESICDTHNSGVAEIHEEYDEDGGWAWDEVGRRNMDFIAHAKSDLSATVQEIERLRAENEELKRNAAEDAELGARMLQVIVDDLREGF